MSIKEENVWMIQNLMDSKPEAQVVELYIAEKLEAKNIELQEEIDTLNVEIKGLSQWIASRDKHARVLIKGRDK
mgnify:CR=1 FL=1|tara:strand:+ start:1778 stop:1999 length:222 start_codon:yes stop_codon:yes gene_type:complete